MTIAELKKIIADAGGVGAGGAGFPSAVKLAEGADSLVINAAECEPLLYLDCILMKRHLKTIAQGAEYVIEATGIKTGYLGVKEHTAHRLGLTDGQKISEHVQVKCLPNVYPMGDEIILIYQTLGRIVPPGQLPITVGVIVYNCETLYNICHAVRDGKPVTEKWITIGGNVVIDGGPAMGPIIDPQTAVITKTSSGLLILPKNIPAIRSKLANNRTVSTHASANCCQCSICTDMCPRALIGYPLKPHRIVRNSMKMIEENSEAFTEASVCCSCGICELVACCQGISPRRVYQRVKGVLAKNKLRYTHDGSEMKADPNREYRMLPSDRFKRLIGVAPFDTGMPPFIKRDWFPTVIELPFRQHIGASAKTLVKVGDRVQVDQLIAEADGVVSANIHSSVNGVVAEVTASKVVIHSDR